MASLSGQRNASPGGGGVKLGLQTFAPGDLVGQGLRRLASAIHRLGLGHESGDIRLEPGPKRLA